MQRDIERVVEVEERRVLGLWMEGDLDWFLLGFLTVALALDWCWIHQGIRR